MDDNGARAFIGILYAYGFTDDCKLVMKPKL